MTMRRGMSAHIGLQAAVGAALTVVAAELVWWRRAVLARRRRLLDRRWRALLLAKEGCALEAESVVAAAAFWRADCVAAATFWQEAAGFFLAAAEAMLGRRTGSRWRRLLHSRRRRTWRRSCARRGCARHGCTTQSSHQQANDAEDVHQHSAEDLACMITLSASWVAQDIK